MARARKTAAGLLGALALAACAPTTYAGIPLRGGAADSELQELARRAHAGDKQAQLQLGIAFEDGLGVPVDLDRASRLYQQAASDSGGAVYIYSPPVGREGSGRVIPVANGPRRQGLAAARARLVRLQRCVASSSPKSPPQGPAQCADALPPIDCYKG